MRRIQDAVKAAWAVLWGHSSQQRQMRDIRMQWTETLIEIDTMFEKVNALVARLAKRQKRLEAPEHEALPMLAPPTEPSYDRKGALRERVASRKNRSSRASVTTPPGHQEETA